MKALLLTLALYVVASGSAAAPPPDAERIIRLAGAQPGERVPFTEERFNELLAAPMTFAGYVSMTDDGILLRVVEEPFEETATIDAEQATLTRDGVVRRVDLDRRGRGGAYLRTLYALLTGNARALEEQFALEVEGEREQWRLVLTPTRRALQRELARIVVSGSGDVVERIRMERSNGAWQDMRLERDTR